MKKLTFLALCCFAVLANAYELKKITAPPEIDGKADALWQTAPALPLVKWRSNKAAPLMPSTVKFLYDDANLYCLAEFSENNMNEALMQSSKYPRRDAPVFENDCCELFIDPFMDGKRSFHLIVDIHGGIADFLHGDTVRYRNALKWDGFWRGEVHRSDEMWCVEYAIPWHTIGIAPGKGRVFGIDLSRARRCNPPERSVLVDAHSLRTTEKFIRMSVDLAPLPVTGSVEHSALFSGSNTLHAILQNSTPAPLDGTLLIAGTSSCGEIVFEKKIPFSIPAKKSIDLPIQVSFPSPGTVNISSSAALKKQTVFISSISAAVQPPFDINDPHPMVFQGEKWGVYLRIFTSGKRDMVITVLKGNRAAAQRIFTGIQGKSFINLPTENLPPGEYTLRIASGKDSITVPLRTVPRI